jgi:hypothetical protein
MFRTSILSAILGFVASFFMIELRVFTKTRGFAPEP